MSADKALPLKVRQSIRDKYDANSSGIAQRLQTIKGNLGQTVIVDPQWAVLWQIFKSSEPDQDNFGFNVALIVRGLLDVFIKLLDNDGSEELFEKLLTDLQGKASLRIILEAAADVHERFAHVSWRSREAQMVLLMPRPGFDRSPRLGQTLEKDLKAVLAGEPPAAAAATSISTIRVQEEDQWDVVTQERAERLPSLDEIDTPDLLLSRPPYLLRVEHYGRSIRVTCGHEGSLTLLEDYLKRWTRKSEYFSAPNNDMVKIRLGEAAFGQRTSYDSLLLEAAHAEHLTPMLIVAFVQGVLKYKLVDASSTATSWTFQRDAPFA